MAVNYNVFKLWDERKDLQQSVYKIFRTALATIGSDRRNVN